MLDTPRTRRRLAALAALGGMVRQAGRDDAGLGEAVHKGNNYPGEHEPIIDRATDAEAAPR